MSSGAPIFSAGAALFIVKSARIAVCRGRAEKVADRSICRTAHTETRRNVAAARNQYA